MTKGFNFRCNINVFFSFLDFIKVKKKANEIFSQFLVSDATQAVNIDHLAIKSASSCLSHPHVDMFLEAENQVN